jgi:hypothetical protein
LDVPQVDRTGYPPGHRKIITMALPFETASDPHDPRAVRILAKSIYRELRATGFSERDVMALAGELLSLVTSEVRGQSSTSDGR